MRTGMFARDPNPASVKLAAMYHQMNERFANALMDHQWWELVEEMEMTGELERQRTPKAVPAVDSAKVEDWQREDPGQEVRRSILHCLT